MTSQTKQSALCFSSHYDCGDWSTWDVFKTLMNLGDSVDPQEWINHVGQLLPLRREACHHVREDRSGSKRYEKVTRPATRSVKCAQKR